ncbi:hypothetical protein HanXRQr2_Chr02g0047351 [Helianthus annuus]|uniref:Uncharacterized protein n=1 Tax=Helianthus annuus TaxID=4232 RepID=A0A9K3JK35_HELAN|nr:hypothetical protein HanXRQr2_Chr02g0047351 [Helianthus annuus]KAJ0950318.1 hypothetical protein HanPSC8_Chr02g0046911 [Helianthus annuus]
MEYTQPHSQWVELRTSFYKTYTISNPNQAYNGIDAYSYSNGMEYTQPHSQWVESRIHTFNHARSKNTCPN